MAKRFADLRREGNVIHLPAGRFGSYKGDNWHAEPAPVISIPVRPRVAHNSIYDIPPHGSEPSWW